MQTVRSSLLSLSACLACSLLAETAFAQGKQSYSPWVYVETNQRYKCTYETGVAMEQLTVIYTPSRPDFFYYHDSTRGGYWARCATPHHPQADPVQPQWSYFENEQWTELTKSTPETKGGPRIEPPSLPPPRFDPDAPLDLTEAVVEMQEVFAAQQLPGDWYSSLQGETPLGSDKGKHRLYLTALWKMVEPEATRRFCRRYQLAHRPSGEIHNGAVVSQTRAFEEAIWLAVAGLDHQHTKSYTVRSPREADLPSLAHRHLLRDGSVSFQSIHEAISKSFGAHENLGLNESESRFDERRRFAEIVSNWSSPSGSPPEWALRQLAWRFVIRVEFVSGTRTIPFLDISGERRLAVDGFIEVGYRKNDDDTLVAIHRAGPLRETAYAVTGKSSVSLAAYEIRWVPPRVCSHDFHYRDLNPPTHPEDSSDEPQSGKQPGLQPSLVSAEGSHEDAWEWHQQIHDLLAPGQVAVP
ncbi:MAG: hypothetical protein KDA58_04150 [Planctomycetaceae bacterium]|nr:hypothetical protein [Planctomycetaceae bacterium]